MIEHVVSLIAAVGDWYATVDGRHVRVCAWAVVELTDTLDGEPETWRVIRAVTPGCEVETVGLEYVHPADECQAHEQPAPVPMRRRGAA
jgi:hypothetical protein